MVSINCFIYKVRKVYTVHIVYDLYSKCDIGSLTLEILLEFLLKAPEKSQGLLLTRLTF